MDSFFDTLVSSIEQVERQLHSGNINILEYWSRRLDDFINVLAVIVRGFSDVDAPTHLIQFSNDVLKYVQLLRDKFLESVSTDHTFMECLANTQRSCPTEENQLCGRPKFAITREEIERLYHIHLDWIQVSYQLGVSERTLRRRRAELGMDISSSQGPRSFYSDITDDELFAIIKEVLNRAHVPCTTHH